MYKCNSSKAEKCMKNLSYKWDNQFKLQKLTQILLMKTKNGYILIFSENILCFATCDWFCPMMLHCKVSTVRSVGQNRLTNMKIGLKF